jgi:hypothetical protein
MYQMGGGGEQPFDRSGAEVIGAMRSALGGRQPYQRALTEQERTEAQQQAQRCLFCAGIHAGMSTPGCPRLASFKLDGDGRITEGTFWEGTDWAAGRVIFAEDAAEDSEEESAMGGDD